MTFFRAFAKPSGSSLPLSPLMLDQSAGLVVEKLKESEVVSATSVDKLMAFAPVDHQ